MTMERREDAEHVHTKTALQVNDQAGKTMGNEVNETRDKERNNSRSDFRGGQDTAATHLPNVELTDSSKVGGKPDQRLQLISDSNAKPEERLAAARELAKEGVSKIELQNDKGERQSLRLETSKAGARDLISIHSADGSGKEKPLLKGVANGDGSIERQKDSKGRFVDWHGSGKEISPSLADATPRIHSRHSKAGEQASGATTEQKAAAKPETTERKVEPKIEPKVEAKPGEKPADKPEAKPDAKVEGPSTIDPHKIMDAAALRAGHPVGKLVKTEDGLYMRAKFDVDADGHPNVKKIDPRHGNPNTTLRYAEGNGSVNADAVPYVVLPKGQFKEHGVKVGDLAIVRNKENGALTVAVFGDVGPRHKRGEGSMALARELGLNPSPTHGGTQSRNIEYLAIPGSGGEKARNQTELLAKINSAKQKLGLRG